MFPRTELLAKRIGRPGPLALGLDVLDCGALIAEARVVQDRLYTIGIVLLGMAVVPSMAKRRVRWPTSHAWYLRDLLS